MVAEVAVFQDTTCCHEWEDSRSVKGMERRKPGVCKERRLVHGGRLMKDSRQQVEALPNNAYIIAK